MTEIGGSFEFIDPPPSYQRTQHLSQFTELLVEEHARI